MSGLVVDRRSAIRNILSGAAVAAIAANTMGAALIPDPVEAATPAIDNNLVRKPDGLIESVQWRRRRRWVCRWRRGRRVCGWRWV
jgi:hypothetical protein